MHVSSTNNRAGYERSYVFLGRPDWKRDMVIKVVDSSVWWGFDNSDIYTDLKVGSSYCLTFRYRIFSDYPKIVAYSPD